jgi:hypothetical protein
MEPDEIKMIRRAADEAEEALLRVTDVARDPGLPAHQREELNVICSSLKDAAIRMGNMCDLVEADLQRARRTPLELAVELPTRVRMAPIPLSPGAK